MGGGKTILTHRDKRALTVAGSILFIFFVAGTLAPNIEAFNGFMKDWEILYLIFIVIPLGLYVATDPEKLNSK